MSRSNWTGVVRTGFRRLQPAIWLVGWLCLLIVGCRPQVDPATLPTPVVAAPSVTALIVVPSREVALVPATWTPEASATPRPAGILLPTLTPRPSRTAPVFPSKTPTPLASTTPSITPLATEISSATPVPSSTALPPPADGPNLLNNPSFEEGWYHINGIPELQVPARWDFEWELGNNPLDPDPWNDWVRPEIRVLPSAFLPPSEHGLFIWDGDQTVKIFKGRGAISFRLLTNVYLEPGTYLFELKVFPDLVIEYTSTGKVWATDPLSGEVSFIVDGQRTGWVLPTFGRRNTLTHVFTRDSAGVVRVGAAMRGRWAIENNGWFMDDWSLIRVGG